MQSSNEQTKGKGLKFVCLSDTHNQHPKKLEKGDVLIHCGDFTCAGDYKEVQNFNRWLDEQKEFKYKIIIAGNHDLSFDTRKYPQLLNYQELQQEIQYLKKNFIYLENSDVDIEGYKIWGSPHSLEYWYGAFQISPDESENIWKNIHDQTDIVLTHGPPYGHGDMSKSEVHNNVGDQQLLQRIKQIKPKYHIFGHIHEAYGKTEEDGITFINCSYFKNGYSFGNKPFSFTLPYKEQQNR
ncbi:unnamed protein product (macronuclear) [Paramecium tetraurelia]|uniref:Calcineurin-like phosphoesterase domain-containing protein n=1 Tax=Paramecium tetraurelia TaxID=5888 RepID=A0DYZ0_PARTE|nr:uncharacterized protein GSPATT00003225001 [Paramecium tetraurelia]CAK88257.1 unnamed protein product [Paramecium tetraurelia]|eukprot:XP_001455654.1 hypothetical protein (macronuclear) [Paramecium tetraurelia strain d4-2]